MVAEYFDFTEITDVTDIVTLSSGNAQPTSASIALSSWSWNLIRSTRRLTLRAPMALFMRRGHEPLTCRR